MFVLNKKFIKEGINLDINHPMWIFMSEANLRLYLMVKIDNLGIKSYDTSVLTPKNDFHIMVVDNNGRLKKKY